MRLLRPISATPAATSDWVEHAIASSPYVSTLGTRIVDDAGYAALIIATDDELRFARATTPAPAAATDWAISPAGSGVLGAGVLLRLASGWGVFASGEYRTTAAAVPAMASDWSMPEVVTYAPVHVAGGMEYMGKPWIACWSEPVGGVAARPLSAQGSVQPQNLSATVAWTAGVVVQIVPAIV